MLTEMIKRSNQPSNTNSIFGGGPPKPAFGTSNTTGTSIFGGNTGGNAFGTSNKYVFDHSLSFLLKQAENLRHGKKP